MPELSKKRFNEFQKWTDWDRFLDGKVYRLVAGKDFKSLASMRVAAHQAAERRGRSCRTSADGADLIVQFTNEAGDYDERKTANVPKRGSRANSVQRAKSAATDSKPTAKSNKRRG